MNNKHPLPDAVRAALLSSGAAGYGVVSVSALFPAGHTLPDALLSAKSIVCTAFPYFSGFEKGNVSYYARGRDYHSVLRYRIKPVVDKLLEAFPSETFTIYVDSGVLPEVRAARLSGLAMTGKNGLAILPPYGSFIFLGFIVSSAVFDETGQDAGFCENCGCCLESCPTGALSSGDMEHCVSFLTQKKGELPPSSLDILSRSETVWGCDLCQLCCPHNADPKKTEIPEFLDTICSITYENVANLSDKSLKSAFPERAFTYRGAAVLRRNLGPQGK